MEVTCVLRPPFWLDERDYHDAQLGVLPHGRPVYCRFNGREVVLGRTKKHKRTPTGTIELTLELDDRLPETKQIKKLLSKDSSRGTSIGTTEKVVPKCPTRT